jgi:regulator of sirC expression with transglutaminase-like and TPR domain
MELPIDARQAKAVEQIFASGDADLAELTIREIRAQEDRYEKMIGDLAKSADAKVQARARLILRYWGKIDSPGWKPTVAQPELRNWENLETFCWQLAEVENPGADWAAGMAYLDELGRSVAKNLPLRSVSPTDSISTLRQVLARREGFRGNLEDYFHPGNSYLHRVLETRLGIPLTLALVYIFAGQRAGLEVYGLNTPGHYLAGIGGVAFDPFHGGVVFSADDLAAKFGTERSCWANPMYMRATPRDTAERMLVNLLNSYSRLGDEARHARTVSYLQMIEESLG